jgi:hypothetical protein
MRRGLRQRIRLRPAGSHISLSNLVQGLVTILVAVAAAVAALVTGSASGKWQESAAQETTRSLATIEDVRFVYTAEAPGALEVAFAEARAEELRGGQAATERAVLAAARKAMDENNLAARRYALPDGGYDVPGRLADVRQQNADLVRLDPDEALEAGDRRFTIALLILGATVPLVLLYVIADAVLRRRQPPAAASREEPSADVGLVPRPWSSGTRRRLWVSVALVAWLVITLLPALQQYYAGEAQRTGALAARKGTEFATMLQASNLASSFAITSQQRALWVSSHGLGSQLAALDSTDPGEARELAADGRTEQAVGARALEIAVSMGRSPSTQDDLDPATVRAVNASQDDVEAVVSEKRSEDERAADLGAKGTRIAIAILFGALAGSLCALAAAAAVRAKRHTWLDLASLAVLGLAIAAVASVPFL